MFEIMVREGHDRKLGGRQLTPERLGLLSWTLTRLLLSSSCLCAVLWQAGDGKGRPPTVYPKPPTCVARNWAGCRPEIEDCLSHTHPPPAYSINMAALQQCTSSKHVGSSLRGAYTPRLSAPLAPSRRKLCVRAGFLSADQSTTPTVLPPPAGVSLPPQQPSVPPAMFGFVDWAEKMNSRAAMLGFFGILLIEAVANKGILELFGMRVGNGLGFEF